MSLGNRLREERERLGLNQTDMAALSGSSKRSQIDWEKGVAVPNAAYLTAIAAAGADVTYVLFGWRPPEAMREHLQRAAEITLDTGDDSEGKERMQRLFVDSVPRELPAPYAATADTTVLSVEERKLIDNYRHAGAEGKKALDAASAALVVKVVGKKG